MVASKDKSKSSYIDMPLSLSQTKRFPHLS
jgi:hypothetical protein